MNIEIVDEVDNERIVNFLKEQKNCIACLNEPPGGTIMRTMEKKSEEIKSLKWFWFPNANTFELLTVNSEQEVKSVDAVQYKTLDDLVEEMCLFAMVVNLIKTKEELVRIPKGSFILVFDENSPGLDVVSQWRRLQETKLLFTCKQSEWSRAVFPENGVYKWQGSSI